MNGTYIKSLSMHRHNLRRNEKKDVIFLSDFNLMYASRMRSHVHTKPVVWDFVALSIKWRIYW